VKQKLLGARAVLFDWDGTLLDSFAADTRAYLAMFKALGVTFTRDDLARHYHPDWTRVYRALRIQRSRWSRADKLWREAYALEKPQLLPGTRAVLRTLLKRFTLGLVTSGDGSRVRTQLEMFKLTNWFAACVCSEDAAHKKPHPAPLERALEMLRVAPEDAVYVGDSAQDMEMARRAGVRAIGVFGPFPTEKGLRAAKPALLLNSVEQLPGCLTRASDSRQSCAITVATRPQKARPREGERKRWEPPSRRGA
jgi:HAD superfamily hydrolase (TIGR01549 family)